LSELEEPSVPGQSVNRHMKLIIQLLNDFEALLPRGAVEAILQSKNHRQVSGRQPSHGRLDRQILESDSHEVDFFDF
jgi:hypothetical protein